MRTLAIALAFAFALLTSASARADAPIPPATPKPSPPKVETPSPKIQTPSPAALPTDVQQLRDQWMQCTAAAAKADLRSSRPAEAVADAALQRCKAQEQPPRTPGCPRPCGSPCRLRPQSVQRPTPLWRHRRFGPASRGRCP